MIRTQLLVTGTEPNAAVSRNPWVTGPEDRLVGTYVHAHHRSGDVQRHEDEVKHFARPLYKR